MHLIFSFVIIYICVKLRQYLLIPNHLLLRNATSLESESESEPMENVCTVQESGSNSESGSGNVNKPHVSF